MFDIINKKGLTMKKRIITAVIAALLIISFVLGMTACGNTSANDAASVANTQVGDTGIWWEYKADSKTLVISGTGDIPGADDSTQIPWYSVRHSVETVEITAENVSAIGNYAFYYMPNLKNVTIPESVKTLGKGAFAFCSSLEAINLPVGLESIGDSCFEACTSLEGIVVRASVKSIGARAFAHCSKLERVYIMSAPEKLNGGTFMGCSNLTTFVMNEACASDGKLNIPFEVIDGVEQNPFNNGCAIDASKISFIAATTEEVTLTITYEVPDGKTAPETEVITGLLGAPYYKASPVVDGCTTDKTVVEGKHADNETVIVTYTEIAPETEEVTEVPAETEPVEEESGEPKSKIGYIIAIIIFVLVIAGIAVFAVITIKSDKKNEKNSKTAKKSDKKSGKK